MICLTMFGPLIVAFKANDNYMEHGVVIIIIGDTINTIVMHVGPHIFVISGLVNAKTHFVDHIMPIVEHMTMMVTRTTSGQQCHDTIIIFIVVMAIIIGPIMPLAKLAWSTELSLSNCTNIGMQ